MARLIRDRVIVGNDPSKHIVADTSASLMQKIHQLCYGTIKFTENDEGEQESMILDRSKAEAIHKNFDGQSKAILYKFVEEGKMLEEEFPNFTRDWQEFEADPSRTFIGQMVSSREGISLWKADVLIYFNIDHSAVTYLQGRDRLTKQERTKPNNVWFLFSDFHNGIENKIYSVVRNKENYHKKVFEMDYGVKRSAKEQAKESKEPKGTGRKSNQISMFS